MFDRIIYKMLDKIVSWCERYKEYKIKKSLPQRKVVDINPIIIRKLFEIGRNIDHHDYKGSLKNKEYIKKISF